MPFSVEVTKHFTASHGLYNYLGKDEDLHAEQWCLKVEVRSDELDEAGCCVDFHALEKTLDELLSPIIGKSFNELLFFKTLSPSAENIAYYFHTELSKIYNSNRLHVYKVTAYEDEYHAASYWEKT
ncbi:MAG: 6-carboxytetrahydropterin synthase QueD [Deltaproteobacteria bacterium CG_4_10_14_0_2_um_filter_43_8]|nr:MAG: 6-carboxytetrahydropterin synthase QueD [Deltaproteobacteria bacterium CG11_big_fil_rev_8_21_14_0_20_42_23]PJA19218.1 MAG: 6-carboxytetrahydropterin synthase QueD [Deltaproteobacteria bacterium CG_4_10_14_0_2_um_filter_43_8]PJC64484.1 MAG: 6-carboxytetrahydropterin synthase QueD [Deltaproteobacteria bacterium CG_4_9_14_0_2_um_filter_42_21]